MAHATKVQRMFELVKLFQARERWTSGELAERLGCAKRTVFRDLHDLHDLGFVCVGEAQDGLRLISSGTLRPINFESEELLALQVAAGAIPSTGPLAKSLRSAMDRIRAVAGPNRRKLAQRLEGRLELRPRDTSKAEPPGLTARETLACALAEQRRVEARYQSVHDGGPIETLLEPYAQVFRGHAWYVVGHAALFGEVRVFRLDRFERVRLLDERFFPPPGFSAAAYFQDAWGVQPGPREQVCIRFAPRLRLVLESSRQHPTQTLELEASGAVLFRATVAGLEEIERWVLGFGGDAEALEPPELRRRVAAGARAAARLYEPPPEAR